MCGSKRAVDRADDPASTSGLRLPSAVRHAITAMARDDPALGLASCRVDGHMTVQPSGLDPVSDHQPPETHGPPFFVRPRSSNPLMGLRRLLPDARFRQDDDRFRGIWLVKATSLSCALRRILSAGAVSPSLQRIDGADASPLPPAPRRWGSSLSEVLHLP